MTALNLYTECEDPEEIIEAFKKFAEYHVEKALKEASEKGRIESTGSFGGYVEFELNKESVLNAYPLENIK